MLGIDPHRFLTADPFEQRILERVIARAQELADVRDSNLAVLIRNQIGELFGG